MKKVKSLKYNWHQVGSVSDRDGCGEDWSKFSVGFEGVIEIMEEKNGDSFSYLITKEDGSQQRIFNPNFVDYL